MNARRYLQVVGRSLAALVVGLGTVSCSDDSPNNPSDPAGKFAVAYINPDIGIATANSDVNADSECENPDQEDSQRIGALGTTTTNVHVDGCIANAGDGGQSSVDERASWEVSGVGVISACPDPDATGPKTATLSGNRCTVSGFQTRGMAGDNEYHVRVNNTSGAGDQRVTLCSDPEGDGCGNASASSTVVIHWVR